MSYAQRLQASISAPPAPPPPQLTLAPPPPPPPPGPPAPDGYTSWQEFLSNALEGVAAALDGEDLAGVVGLVRQACNGKVPTAVFRAAQERLTAMDDGDVERWYDDGPRSTHRSRFRERWASFDLGPSPL